MLMNACHPDMLALTAGVFFNRGQIYSGRNDHAPLTNRKDRKMEASGLTEDQEKLLSLLPILPAFLSVLSSGTIIFIVVKSGFETVYKRILLGLSTADIITSVSFVLQHFLIPAETSPRVWAIGNDLSCTILGALSQLGTTCVLYNGFLALYFLCTVRFGVKERTFARRCEFPLHVFIVGFPLVAAMISAPLGVYGETEIGIGCFFDDPDGCAEGECHSGTIAWALAGIWVVITMPAILIINAVIYFHARREVLRGARASFSGGQLQAQQIRQVVTQATLYVMAFTGTFIWTIALRVCESQGWVNELPLFPIMVLQAVFLPSTGVFNALIYLRPRYLRTRVLHPSETRMWAFRRALYGESVQVVSQPPLAGTSGECQRNQHFGVKDGESFETLAAVST